MRKLHPADNVLVSLEDGHKYAAAFIPAGADVVKYGCPIGHALADIPAGGHVHTHNLKTNLNGKLDYTYQPQLRDLPLPKQPRTFQGYLRENGDAGIRNDVWIVPTVGCVNGIAQVLAQRTGAFAFAHPFGCSQLGGDHLTTQQILCALANHPNACGVLVLGLGCENNHIAAFQKQLGQWNPDRVKFLNTQDAADELAEGTALVQALQTYAAQFQRQTLPVSKLKIGLKCGGSDGFSGITANPLVGRVSDLLVSHGGSSVLTEVPEMFGAEQLLLNRCKTRAVFDQTVSLVNGFKDYFLRHGQPVYENPSPGNKAGGITTLEEKSLGCVQKGGTSNIVDVLGYGGRMRKSGLHLLDGPGNDLVAVTNLAACGAQMILFTTGRGTPLGAPVPVVKISTNTALFRRKPGWIDFDAGALLGGADFNSLSMALFDFCLGIAGGTPTRNEQNGYRDISIFKDGVTL